MSEIFAIIYILGAGQGGFIAVLLFLRRANRHANSVLALLLAVFALNLFELFLEETGVYNSIPHILWSFTSAGFLYGPLLFLYAGLLTGRITRLKPLHLLHFLPFFIHAATLIPFYLKTGEMKIHDYNHYLTSGFPVTFKPLFTYSLKLLHFGGYLGAALIIIHKYRKDIETRYSELSVRDLAWFSAMIYINLASLFLLLLGVVGHGLGIFVLTHGFTRFSYLWMTILIYIIGSLAVRQAPIFGDIIEKSEAPLTPLPTAAEELPKTQEEQAVEEPLPIDEDEKKYEKSRLDNHISDAYLKELSDHMSRKKPYLDSDITIRDLAAQIGLTEHTLSQVINGRVGVNFYTFVNNYRVEEAKRLLNDRANSGTNILSIAFSAGFKSKSHFNTLFKKVTGLTPSEFRSKNKAL